MNNLSNVGMKKSMLLAALMLLSLSLSAQKKNADDEGLKVMSYNIRLGEAKDGTNSWNLRYPATAEMILDQAPDVFGVQEAMDYQVLFIDENFKNYENVGVGRENGKKKGEHMSIFWNKKTVSMLKWGTFWLSETPDKPSKGWDAECFRTATWALMKDKETGRKFYFVNTHLDHVGKESRRNGLNLIMERIAQLNTDSLPVVLTGDFNMNPDDPALSDLDAKMSCTRRIAEKTDSHDTFNGWGRGKGIIDYIYCSGFSSCSEYQTVTKRYADRKFISDHYPVCAVLIF